MNGAGYGTNVLIGQLEVNTPDRTSFETTDGPEYCIEIM